MATALQLRDDILAHKHDAALAALYGGEDKLPAQRKRYADALAAFAELFGPAREVAVFSTPGRTEIGGNHTDHNNGVVMAAAVDLDILAVAAKTSDKMACVHSEGFPDDSVDLAYLVPDNQEFGTSAALVRGMAAGVEAAGGTVGGFDVYTTSDVLPGSGLSSSAAFEVCMGTILNELYNAGRFTPLELAMMAQRAENRFFGKPSGLMDQTACAVGGAITIDFADPTKPQIEKIPFDLAKMGYYMVITDTKGSHANLTDAYAAIRSEMEGVAAHFGKKVLREVEEQAFLGQVGALRQELGDRAVLRAIHFFAECRRAKALAHAAQDGALPEFLSLIVEGGHSSFEYNQNAYSAQNPAEQGVSLGLALSQGVLQGQGAWRLQGGGFAGTIQAFVPLGLLSAYCERLGGVFGADACHVVTVRPAGSVRVL